MYFIHAAFVLLALAVSLLLNRLMLAVAPRIGLMDEPGERRIHAYAIPRAGGIAIWLTFLLVISGGLASGWLKQNGYLSWPWLCAFAAGSSVLMVAGFMDDRSGLPPLVKLAAHALAPTLFFLLHPVEIGLFPVNWPWACNYVLFVVWVVMLINAFNLIDGLDGLCGGLAAVSSFALAGMSFANGRADSAWLLLVMGGAVLGFLKYNINPARIFLGDAGSMLLGFFLATAATEAVGRKALVGVILLPIAVAGVPLLDVLLAIWRRGARRYLKQLHGEKIAGGLFDADGDHLHHRLLASEGNQSKVAAILHGIAVLLSLLAFLPLLFGNRVMGLSLVGFLIIGMVGVKHLARVEMEHTGNMIHMVIKLPTRHRRVAAILFMFDLLVLAGSGIAAGLLETNWLSRGPSFDDVVRFALVFLVIGSVATLIVRVHQRLWVRATMRDILTLQTWLLVAAVATFTLFTLVYAHPLWSSLRLAVMSYVFASFGVCLPRAALNMIQEMGMDARHRNPKAAAAHEYGPVVVLGAGDLGTLLLDHLRSCHYDMYPGMRVLGFIDERPVLHGRRLRSFQILGGLSAIPGLVEKSGLRGIILAIKNPREELVNELDRLAAAQNVKIYRWKVGMEEM